MMVGSSHLRINCPARPEVAKPIRHAVAAFLAVFDLDPEFSDDVLTATGEALANAIEHAYAGSEEGDLELHADFEEPERLCIEVYDRGRFIRREPQPDRGFGIRIVQSIAKDVRIETDDGTVVRMEFRPPPDR